MSKKALYLAGGGARGAYQAGVLKAISALLGTDSIPFEIVSGVSVGSLNAAVLVEQAEDFAASTDKLNNLWANIDSQNIFNASNLALSKSVFQSLRHRQSGYILDTEALSKFISNTVDFDKLRTNINGTYLEAMEVICHCYDKHQTISFYQHVNPHFEDWHYPRHSSQKVAINKQLILGSSALPLFFPPAEIDGLHYGDGSMGLVAPLRGAIRCQVDSIMILGTRQLPVKQAYIKHHDIGLANILGDMMTGLFLDNLDHDIEMVNRMNEISRLLSIWKKRRAPWRPIKTLHLRPSKDLATLAQAHYKSMPTLLRFLLNMFGAKSQSGDLVSFLLFEKEFTRDLLKLGFEDTMAAKETILTFFRG